MSVNITYYTYVINGKRNRTALNLVTTFHLGKKNTLIKIISTIQISLSEYNCALLLSLLEELTHTDISSMLDVNLLNVGTDTRSRKNQSVDDKAD